MDTADALDPIRSLRAAWSGWRAGSGWLRGRGMLLFFSEIGGAIALSSAVVGSSGSHASQMAPVAWLLGGSLFLVAGECWIRIARPVGSARTMRHRFTMIGARVCGELLTLGVLLPSAIVFGAVLELPDAGPGADFTPIWIAMALGVCATAYVYLGLSFVPQIAAFEDVDAPRAIERSWSLARGRRLRLLYYHVVIRVLLALAACTCVGLFVAGPLVSLSRIESYLALTRERDLSAPPA